MKTHEVEPFTPVVLLSGMPSGRIPDRKEVLQGNGRLQDVQVLKLAMSRGAAMRPRRPRQHTIIFKKTNNLFEGRSTRNGNRRAGV